MPLVTAPIFAPASRYLSVKLLLRR